MATKKTKVRGSSKSKMVVSNSVVGTKISKTGKSLKPRTFTSVREAAEKIAPESRIETATRNIYHVLEGNRKSAYGYTWSR